MRSATEVRRVIIIGKIEGVIVLAVIFMEVWVIPIICINSPMGLILVGILV